MIRRFFFVLLVLILPLQAAWAAVSSYCLHEQGVATQHFGHHDHQHHGDAFSPKRAMAYRFRIEVGRIAYLGNVDLRMTEQDMYDITAENRAKRDLALLVKKLPSVIPGDILFRPGELRLCHSAGWQDLKGAAQ